MEFIINLPAFVKILFVFTVILFAGRTRFPFGITLFTASLLIGVWFGLEPVKVVPLAFKAAFSSASLSLLLMVVLIAFFSGCLQQTGELQKVVDSFGSVFKSTKLKLAALPALIGLLPMPGGAFFSAPMVGSAASGHEITPERKTNINYFFRHIWEPWWPLFPGVILFVSLTDISFIKMVLLEIPVTLMLVLVGYFVFLKDLDIKEEPFGRTRKVWSFFKNIFPIILIFIIVAAYKVLLYAAPFAGLSFPPHRYFPIVLGLTGAIIYVIARNKLSFRDLLLVFFSKKNVDIGLMVMGIMTFKAIMEQSGAVHGLKADLEHYNFPLLLVIVFLPFFSGAVFGIMIGTIGASFPLLIPMIMQSELASHAFLYFMLAYAAAFCGMMVSPVHVCMVLTKRYFNVSYFTLYKRLLPAIFISGAIWFFYIFILLKLGQA